MNKNTILSLFVIFICQQFTNHLWAQNEHYKNLRKARKALNDLEFDQSRNYYLEILNKSPEHFHANYELGITYQDYYMKIDSALVFLQNAEKYMIKDTIADVYYRLGNAYFHYERYDEALSQYDSYMRITKGKEKEESQDISLKKQQIAFAQSYDQQLFEGEFFPIQGAVNTTFNEYAQVYMESDSTLFFTRRSPQNPGDMSYDLQHAEDMYYTSWMPGDEVETVFNVKDYPPFKSIVQNTRIHESFVDLGLDDNMIILYNKNMLYYMEKVNGEWQKPQKFPEQINRSSLQRHATITTDGKTMIYSSLNKKKKNGLDLYYVTKGQDGEWGEPINLGTTINTEYDEDSPLLKEGGEKLYFASKGHQNMGGYDIFVSVKETVDDKGSPVWSEPVNLGRPINSSSHDIFFNFKNDEQVLLLSSNRPGSVGGMDIFVYDGREKPEFKDCDTILYVLGRQMNEKDWVEGSDTITIEEEAVWNWLADKLPFKVEDTYWKVQDKVIKEKELKITFDEPGTYQLDVEVNNKQDLSERLCLTRSITVITPEQKQIIAQNQQNNNQSNQQVDAVNESLKNIYFDFDKSTINQSEQKTLQENAEVLLKNPNLRIDIIGHTDSKGPSAYNDRLAKKRAESVKNYLFRKGVSSAQVVTIISKGEKEPAVPNTKPDGSDDPSNRKNNRRVELKVKTENNPS